MDVRRQQILRRAGLPSPLPAASSAAAGLRCEEAVELAEAASQPEIAFLVEGVRRFLLGRLMGSPGGLDG